MTTKVEEASARAVEVSKIAGEAERNATRAWAEVARLTLLQLADENSNLEEIVFETEYQYDDEGAYFRYVSVYPSWKEGYDEDGEFIYDAMNGFGPEVICVLCEEPEDAHQGSLTIERARSIKFPIVGRST